MDTNFWFKRFTLFVAFLLAGHSALALSSQITPSYYQLTSYTIAAGSNRLTAITGSGAGTVSQDANGSIVNDFDRQYAYDLRGRLIQTTTTLGNVNYEVNAAGLRVRKQAAYTGGADTLFFYDGAGHLIGEVPTGTASFTKEYF